MTNLLLQQVFGYHSNNAVRKTPSIFPNAFHWIDDEATVEQETGPGKRGRVNYHGTSWRAQTLGKETLPINGTVKVVGRKNLFLLIEKRR